MRSIAFLVLLGLTGLAPASGRAQARVAPLGESSPPASTARLITGGVAGGALGMVAGIAAGAMIGGNTCRDEGNPDSCRGLEGAAIGMLVGHSVGAPVGTHIANRGRGNVVPGLLLSVGLTTIGMLLIYQAEHGARPGEGASGELVLAVGVGVPLAQLVGSVILERRTSR